MINRIETEFPLTRLQAIQIITGKVELPNQVYSIVCKEYGQDEDWEEVNNDSLNDEGNLDEDYKTFEIWLEGSQKHIEENLKYLKEYFGWKGGKEN